MHQTPDTGFEGAGYHVLRRYDVEGVSPGTSRGPGGGVRRGVNGRIDAFESRNGCPAVAQIDIPALEGKPVERSNLATRLEGGDDFVFACYQFPNKVGPKEPVGPGNQDFHRTDHPSVK